MGLGIGFKLFVGILSNVRQRLNLEFSSSLKHIQIKGLSGVFRKSFFETYSKGLYFKKYNTHK